MPLQAERKLWTKRLDKFRPHPVQRALWFSKERFVCAPCGRQSGKTEIAMRKLVKSLSIDRGHGRLHMYAFLEPTYRQAKRVVWRSLKDLVPPWWQTGPPSEGELVIRCAFPTHEAELHVMGMDVPQRIEGPGWDGVIEDEASDQRADIHLSVRPAVDSREGFWWKIGIPKRRGIGARSYRECCEKGMRGDEGWATYSWPSWDILPSHIIEAARRDFDIKDFNEQYGAQWESIGGAAFYAFDRAVHVRPVAYDPKQPVLVGSDFNVTPMAWVICQATASGKGLNVFDEIWLKDTNTQKTLDVLWDRYGENQKGGWFFYGDGAWAHARKTSASASDYAQIKNDRRFNGRVLYPKSNPAVKDRLASCNALLRNAAGEVRWWIDPRCEHLIADLEHRGLNSDGSPTDAGKSGTDEGHITDAVGYLIHYRWPATYVEPQQRGTISVYRG